MAATKWKTKRVVVEVVVHDDCLSDKDVRWAVETALTSGRTFDEVARTRHSKSEGPVRLGAVLVKHFSKVLARAAMPDTGEDGHDAS